MKARPFFLLIAAVMVVFITYTAAARGATSANWPDPRLDAIAGSIAGHPVQVYCEDDWRTWIYNGEYGIAGFTYLARPVVFINPRECMTLHFLLDRDDVGSIYAAEAMLVLAHESMHQRNWNNANGRNEAVTECLAMKELRDIAVRPFGVPATIDVQTFKTVKHTMIRRVRGKLVKVRYTSVVPTVTTVPNPWLTRLLVDAARWDAALPASYHGATC